MFRTLWRSLDFGERWGADGVNGDTMDGMAQEHLKASEAAGHPLVLEGEGYPAANEMLNYNAMNWGYWNSSLGKWLLQWQR